MSLTSSSHPTIGSRLAEERNRQRLTPEEVAHRLGVSLDDYHRLESGASEMEHWLPILGHVAVMLGKPTSRLIAPSTGKASDAKEGSIGPTVRALREAAGITPQQMVSDLTGVTADHYGVLESGRSGVERYGVLLLTFANLCEVPIFNLIINASVKPE